MTMTDETLTLWENGAVTLPKKWRERYDTKHFLARENERGYLVIMPIMDVEYWEDDNGNFGLHFPTGIEAGELARHMEHTNKKLTNPRLKTRNAGGTNKKSKKETNAKSSSKKKREKMSRSQC